MSRFGLLVLTVVFLATGCSRNPFGFSASPPDSAPASFAGMIVTGAESEPVTWGELRSAVSESQVILLGESHGSPGDHAFQRAFLEWAFDNFDNFALSMEQLERNEQEIVDDFLAGKKDQTSFLAETGSADWAGPGTWLRWYQPLVDLARRHRAPVVAANAPREYSRLAYQDGLAAVEQLPPAEQEFFALPLTVEDSTYREAFAVAASGHDGVTPEMVKAMYAGQQIWDATMAESIARALDGNSKVLHTVGRFHVEEDGGLRAQLRARAPGIRYLVFLPNGDNERASLIIGD